MAKLKIREFPHDDFNESLFAETNPWTAAEYMQSKIDLGKRVIFEIRDKRTDRFVSNELLDTLFDDEESTKEVALSNTDGQSHFMFTVVGKLQQIAEIGQLLRSQRMLVAELFVPGANNYALVQISDMVYKNRFSIRFYIER